MSGKPVLYPPENQEFFYRILEQPFKHYDEDTGGQRYKAFWVLKLGQEFVSVSEIEVDEAGEQGEYDDVQEEITDEPFPIFIFYVSLFWLSQIYPLGGYGSFP